jgi:hypothetical protein
MFFENIWGQYTVTNGKNHPQDGGSLNKKGSMTDSMDA